MQLIFLEPHNTDVYLLDGCEDILGHRCDLAVFAAITASKELWRHVRLIPEVPNVVLTFAFLF